MRSIVIKRIYEPASADDGYRVLVDKLWPRGISKARAALDHWGKELAPSTALRQWFGHDAGRWERFQDSYLHELEECRTEIEQFLNSVDCKRLTLLYAAKDPELNHAAVLRTYLLCI